MTGQDRLDAHLCPCCPRCGRPIGYQEREAHQQPYRGMWQALMAWEQDRHARGDPIYPDDLRRELHRIMDEQPDARGAYAVNTTRYERPLDEVTQVGGMG